MPRTARAAPGGFVYHVLNRGVGRMRLFDKARDYEAFEETLAETLAKISLRVCGFCVMPNHWHFVVWPDADDQLGLFFQRLTVTHATRWVRAKRRSPLFSLQAKSAALRIAVKAMYSFESLGLSASGPANH